jgi:hypothetical protein
MNHHDSAVFSNLVSAIQESALSADLTLNPEGTFEATIHDFNRMAWFTFTARHHPAPAVRVQRTVNLASVAAATKERNSVTLDLSLSRIGHTELVPMDHEPPASLLPDSPTVLELTLTPNELKAICLDMCVGGEFAAIQMEPHRMIFSSLFENGLIQDELACETGRAQLFVYAAKLFKLFHVAINDACPRLTFREDGVVIMTSGGVRVFHMPHREDEVMYPLSRCRTSLSDALRKEIENQAHF